MNLTSIFNFFRNDVKADIGYQQSFGELLDNGDVSRAVSMMCDCSQRAEANLLEYDVSTHKVNKRKDKAVYDNKGNFLRWKKRWRIPIPYPTYINEISVVFLYGRPVKWSQKSEGTDDSFSLYLSLMKESHFNSKVREAKRRAGIEETSAILYHVYRNSEGKPALLLNVLSKKSRDDIFVMKDQYGRLTAFAWGYYLTDGHNNSVRHIDVYTKDTVYECKRGKVGWEVNKRANEIGKIPVLLFEQDAEHKEVQPMIERVEDLESKDADVNDKFADPAMVATAEIINSLPKSEEESKLFILKNGGKVEYLTWNDASQSKTNEYDRLDKHILSKSFTPNVDFDNMKNLGNMSAKAIRKVMMLAVIKADRHKEKHEEYMDRHVSLMKAIMSVMDYKHSSQHEQLVVEHEFQEPFGDDVSDRLADLSKQFNDGALSRESYVEQSYLVKDSKTELDRLKAEEQMRMDVQKELNKMDVFGGAE